MYDARPVRRRLAAAVTAVLAVTLGATGLTAPAIAAPAAEGTTTEAAQSVTPFPRGAELYGVTATGFLTLDKSAMTRSWIRASDGSSTDWSAQFGVQATGSGDIVAIGRPSEAQLMDMATGQQLLKISPLTPIGEAYAGAAGKALFSTANNGTGGKELRMHTKAGGTVTATGLPADAKGVSVTAGTAEHALVSFTTGTSDKHWGLLDLATGSVTETYPVPAAAANGDVAVTATHLAWVEYDTSTYRATVVVRTRGTDTIRRIPLGDEWASKIEVGLVGDWVTYSDRGGLTNGDTSPLYALTAYHLTDGTTRKLLDHVDSAGTAPDGVQFVRGGTVAEGEGVYRIAPEADGAPAATLVASTGEPTKLTLVGHNIPAVIDLDKNRGRVPLNWELSRSNAELKVTLRHVRTGKTDVAYLYHPETPDFGYEWQGDLGLSHSAYNGDYTWEISARPLNGIGPTLTSSGTFKVVRKAALHDYTDNGSPDVLARDASGRLWRSDSYYSPYANAGQLVESEQKLIGSGWGIYHQIEAAGNIVGPAAGDLVARDKGGVLWLYLGKGDGTFAARTRIGGGWGIYNKIAAGSDLTNDGKSDLLATDTSGVLWLYKGTGDWRAPYKSRVKIGTGWNIYNQLTAVGNIAGGTAGDLVARDKDGVLWLYQGRGDGTFAARTRIGGGWNAYTHIVGIGDGDRDGHADLFAYGPNGPYFYPGTGDGRAPFRGLQLTGVVFITQPMYNSVV
ncbi:FG-GAP repeat domain-containing protein [Streptomyces sp. NPDC059909]|uniref:FG-GAP repeat domain-containing protein n=1 Tax=Streptomyces sp. NPDC059909 TaxID=3346998 RepID=UPI0036583418